MKTPTTNPLLTSIVEMHSYKPMPRDKRQKRLHALKWNGDVQSP